MIAVIRQLRPRSTLPPQRPRRSARLLEPSAERPNLVCFDLLIDDGGHRPHFELMLTVADASAMTISHECMSVGSRRRGGGNRRVPRRPWHPLPSSKAPRKGLADRGYFSARLRSSFSAHHAPGFISQLHCRRALAAIRHLKRAKPNRDRHHERAATLKRRPRHAGPAGDADTSHILPV